MRIHYSENHKFCDPSDVPSGFFVKCYPIYKYSDEFFKLPENDISVYINLDEIDAKSLAQHVNRQIFFFKNELFFNYFIFISHKLSIILT